TRFLMVSLVIVLAIALVTQVILRSFIARETINLQAGKAVAQVESLKQALGYIDWQKSLYPGDLAAIDYDVGRFLIGAENLRIWSKNGVILYSGDRTEVETVHPVGGDLARALSGQTLSQIEKSPGLPARLVVWVPFTWRGTLVGAIEIHYDAGPLLETLDHLQRLVMGILFGGMFILWAVIWFMAHSMALRLRRQNRDLLRLQEELKEALRSREATLSGTLAALAEAVEAKDDYVGGHVNRVAEYALMVADELRLRGEERDEVFFGAVLHDIGKIAIPDAILSKPGPLTDEEWAVMKTHSARGEAIISQIPGLKKVAKIIRHHHERYAGGGYPDGIRGEEIPLGSRIVAAVDAFDAMTTDRVYRKARPVKEALAELRREAGRQFDPQVVEALERGLFGHRRPQGEFNHPPQLIYGDT
ncbi:MAG: HD-GYP domain-containing protein, partial [Bacillota bacterium]|nr:HD-GYP domain-containing protein [Bacillota bacterium]